MSKGKERAKYAALVERAIQLFGEKVEEKNITVGEFARLLELQKELSGDEPKEIKITWVESGETEPTTET